MEVLLLDLKSPKESKGNSVRVELFANGKKSCPVRAYKKLLQFWGHVKEWNIPLMTKSEGSMFSGRELNKLLKRLTSNIKKQGGKRILSHSSRSGNLEGHHVGRTNSPNPSVSHHCTLGMSVLYISKYMIILDNSSPDGEACSDVDDDFSIVKDSLLGNSVDFANGTTSTPHSKRQRTSGVQFREPPTPTPVTTSVPTGSSTLTSGAPSHTQASADSRCTANPPQTMSVTNTGHNTVFLTSSDGNANNIGDVMNAMMMQIHSVNKLVSKQEESETTRKRRLEETEVLLIDSYLMLTCFTSE